VNQQKLEGTALERKKRTTQVRRTESKGVLSDGSQPARRLPENMKKKDHTLDSGAFQGVGSDEGKDWTASSRKERAIYRPEKYSTTPGRCCENQKDEQPIKKKRNPHKGQNDLPAARRRTSGARNPLGKTRAPHGDGTPQQDEKI